MPPRRAFAPVTFDLNLTSYILFFPFLKPSEEEEEEEEYEEDDEEVAQHDEYVDPNGLDDQDHLIMFVHAVPD